MPRPAAAAWAGVSACASMAACLAIPGAACAQLIHEHLHRPQRRISRAVRAPETDLIVGNDRAADAGQNLQQLEVIARLARPTMQQQKRELTRGPFRSPIEGHRDPSAVRGSPGRNKAIATRWLAVPGPGCEPALNRLPVQEDLLNRHAGQVREQDVDSLKIAGPE